MEAAASSSSSSSRSGRRVARSRHPGTATPVVNRMLGRAMLSTLN